MAIEDLVSQALGDSSSFNWTWFIELCVSGILVLFFFFYFNRLFATLISYALRAYVWHAYRVWIDIQALQISLLAGRIFFKGIRYHGENETILIQSGFITWRYWLRSVRQVDLTRYQEDNEHDGGNQVEKDTLDQSSTKSTSRDEEQGQLRKNNTGDARIAVLVTGVQWFVYNRTPMYDAIVQNAHAEAGHAGLAASSTDSTMPNSEKVRSTPSLEKRPVSDGTSSGEYPNFDKVENGGVPTDNKERIRITDDESVTTNDSVQEAADATLMQTLLIRLLPLYIECSRAAISLGNEHTRALLVTTVSKARGFVDSSGCGPHDLFRQIFDFEVEQPVVQMRPNADFRASQIATAENLIANTSKVSQKRAWWKPQIEFRRRRQITIDHLRNLVPWFRSSVSSLHQSRRHDKEDSSYTSYRNIDPDGGPWHGLGRYLEDSENDDHQAWANVDYARFSTILDCPAVHFTFYWDVPGRVKQEHFETVASHVKSDINGSVAPGYGLDLVIKGGQVNYGPWADRLRAELQAVFLPASYQSASEAAALPVGAWRQSTTMTIRIVIEEEVTLRVPSKENSKDWRWRGRATAVRDAAALRKQRERRHFRFKRGPKGTPGPDIRPFGWLSVSVAPNSTVRYHMDMVARKSGFQNDLILDLRETRATSSVNHNLLWRCARQKVQGDLSNPLTWNGQHHWQFNVQNDDMDMFLLRDHMFLLTDLIGDFTAGQKADYLTFVPFRYSIGLQFSNLKLYLNANDYNIIDNASDLDNNAFLVLGMQALQGHVDIPMEYYSAVQSSVLFTANGQDLSLKFKAPVWNTLRTFAKYETMATLKGLHLDGSYNYFAAASPQLTDSLMMNIVGRSPKFHLQGFLIRYFMNVKENYFGEDLHFRTFEEYQAALGPDNRLSVEEQKPTSKKDNDLDVILTVRAEQSCAVMPANIYDRSENLRVDVMSIDADMRFTNYYMDLQVNSSPAELSLETYKDDGHPQITNCQLYIDAVSAYGHRLFGAPPSEPTYVCNWEFDVGTILGECSTDFIRILVASIQSFMFTLDDDDNALPIVRSEVLHDITFLRARTGMLRIWVTTEDAGFLIELASFDLNSNDWARDHFSKHLTATIPDIKLAAIDMKEVHRQTESTVPALACVQTALKIAVIDKKAGFERIRELQQAHVRFHDLRTSRAECLLREAKTLKTTSNEDMWSREPPAMPTPEMPTPVRTLAPKLSSKSSFLTAQAKTPKGDTVGRSASAKDQKHTRYPSTSEVSARGSRSEERRATLIPSSQEREDGEIANVASFSSPWIPPYFSLQKISPDTQNMPQPDVDSHCMRAGHELTSYEDEDLPLTDEEAVHAGIFVNLPTGIKAFSSPNLFSAVAALVKGVLAVDPGSVFDNLQRSTISGVKSLSMEKGRQIDDFAVYVPVAAIRLVNPTNEQNVHDIVSDQYDVVVKETRVMIRVSPAIAKQGHSMRGSLLLTHAAVGGIEVGVLENSRHRHQEATGVTASIDEAQFWLSLTESVRTNLQLSSVQLSSTGSSIERFSSLIDRSRRMFEGIFLDLDFAQYKSYARDLVYQLVMLDSTIADPIFLSRPSYVLRSAQEHVRQSDSWKFLSILRQRLLMLPTENAKGLSLRSTLPMQSQPENAKETILKFFQDLRTDERGSVGMQPLLHALFGIEGLERAPGGNVTDFEGIFLLRQMKFVLDPGPRQSEVSLHSCDFNFAQKPNLDGRGMGNNPEGQAQAKRTLQSWVARTTIDLNWELIELVRSLLTKINHVKNHNQEQRKSSTATETQQTAPEDFTVVFGTDKALLRLTGLNIDIEAGASSLKSSVVLQHNDQGMHASLIVASSSTEMRFLNDHKILMLWRLRSPTIYGSYQKHPAHFSRSDSIHLAATCKKLGFEMKENMLYLLDVATAIVRDEGRVIHDIVSMMDDEDVKPATHPNTSRSMSPSIEMHMAFFLDKYDLRLAFLPTLHYIIAGSVARTLITPRGKSKFTVHLDAKRSHHILLRPTASIRNSICTLEIPPLNGRVRIAILDKVIKVGVQTTIEKVVVDATAVQACFDATYRPENTSFVKAVRSAVDEMQSTIQSTFTTHKPGTARPKKPSTERSLLYSTHAVLAGIVVHYSTSSLQVQNSSQDKNHAALKLVLSHMTMHVHNTRDERHMSYKQPQFEFSLPKAVLGLYRQSQGSSRNAGQFTMGFKLSGWTEIDDQGVEIRNYRALSNSVQLDLYTETAAIVVDAAAFLRDHVNHLTSGEDRSHMKPLHRLTLAHKDRFHKAVVEEDDSASTGSSTLLGTTFALNLNYIQARWILADDTPVSPGRKPEDLVFSIRKIELNTQREGSARLTFLDLQLQIVPKAQKDPVERTRNSALLPEMAFKAAHFSTKHDRRFAFQAAGKALDLRLAADGIVPLSAVQKSLSKSIADLRALQTDPNASASTSRNVSMSKDANLSTDTKMDSPPEQTSTPMKGLLGNKRLASLLVDADFAGAILTVTPRVEDLPNTAFGLLKGPKRSRTGRYGQAVQSGSAEEAVLRAPGIAMKVEYMDTGNADPIMSTEVKVAGSSNTLAPTVVPLVLEIYSSVKEIIGEDDSTEEKSDVTIPAQKYLAGAADPATDPTAILGRVKLNIGLWIQRQEFSLTCQPIARVQANAKFDDIFFTLNTVEEEQDRFFSLILKFNNLEASVQHVYSRESTASFEVESIVISLMNSKHVNDKNGISAILNISPMRTNINAKQLQDFLLFREIWYPAEIRAASKPAAPGPTTTESQMYAMRKYQELTTTAALPWHAVVSVQELKVQVDFGQGIGKSSFTIRQLWASSKKNSDWEQNLCIGFERIGIESSGRMSGFVQLENLHARTSIKWPPRSNSATRAPLVQASLGFDHLRVKAAFDYQPFAVADVSSFAFLMYNVRPSQDTETDRLVGIVDGGKVQVFCISTAAGQVLAIVQAFERLLQEKREAYQESLYEVERLLRRKSVFPSSTYATSSTELERKPEPSRTSHLLHTDVVVTLQAVDIGAFPNTFFDSQLLKIEAADAQARFAVATVGGKIRSGLGMSFGQVRVALSAVSRTNTKALGEVEISDVIDRATSSRGGTIVKVPRLVASMQTWQEEHANLVEYIFRSTFQGKVDVGWNYSRISFIRTMWETHSQALAQRLGKPLPPSAVKITAAPQGSGDGKTGQGTITAVVNVPQSSKYEYVALVPPVIDTPQLRDMGEATPPLEWIGLNRDKLPNVTHSIVIVTLMEVAKEVEDAYTRILGTG